MRTAINLSSKPFTNHRLLWITVSVIALISIWTILWVRVEKASIAGAIDDMLMRIENQKVQIANIREQEEIRRQKERTIPISEQDAIQLASARQLIQRKKLSWTRILSDLERYVPKKARITAIKVEEVFEVGKALNARIEIKASGASTGELTEMMTSLEGSDGLFEVGEVSQEAASDAGEIPFTINLTYRPRQGEEE